jgi:nucleoside 2-deoxyribosyltransferase
MRAYIAIKYHPDSRNRPAIEQISCALEQNGFDTICLARDLEDWGRVQFSPEELMQRAFEAINASDLVVVDLTEKGVGIGIEAGYAWAKRKPILTIAQTGADISATLQGISQWVLQYDSLDELPGLFARAQIKPTLIYVEGIS